MRSSSGLLSVDQALAQLLDDVRPVSQTEILGLDQAAGRVLARDICAAVDVPPADNSEMDGYAFRFADIEGGQRNFPVSQRVAAGSVATTLSPGTAARIFTGAFLPPGADTVVMQENCSREGDSVALEVVPGFGQSVRRRAQDIAKGSCAVSAGTPLGAGHLGLLASVGIDRVAVYRRLRVAVLQSGDELIDPGVPLEPGQIYNSNRYLLNTLLQQMGCEVIDHGRIPDSPEQTRLMLANAAASADVVISTGGVSVGEEDHIKGAVDALGALNLWRIALKPGKPLAFGHIAEAAFFGLPGNPSSVFVTLQVMARPWLMASQGIEPSRWHLPSYTVRAGFDWPRAGTRREFLRARLVDTPDGPEAQLYPNQSSGVLSSVAWSDCLAVVREGQTFASGDRISVLLTGRG